MIPKHKHNQPDNVDSWLMSYADMITLLLAFFIVFVATSEPKDNEFLEATKGIQERFGSLALETPLDGAYRDVVGIIASEKQDRNIAIDKTKRGLRMEFSSLHLFEPGSATISMQQAESLAQITMALKAADMKHYIVHIEGHTDDVQPAGTYTNNWELSAARAAKIAQFLVDQGIPEAGLRAEGFAGTQPLVPNRDAADNPIPENRARNQRVVITVERKK